MIRLVLIAWLALCGVANAQLSGGVGGFPGPGTPHSVGAAYSGPGDVVSGASMWFGLRSYNAAYATGSNSAAIVCDTATFLTCSTINILADGSFDKATAAASAACATACVAKSLTDQTGNGHTATCASAAVCATLVFNCLGTLPCLSGTLAASTSYTIASAFGVTTGFTISAVVNRTSGSSGAWFCCTNVANVLFGFNAANQAAAYDGGSISSFSMNDNQANSETVVFNGASSQGVANGVATAIASVGTVGGTVNRLWNGNGQGVTGQWFELGLWPSVFTAGQYTGGSSICHNQFVYWGTAVSC